MNKTLLAVVLVDSFASVIIIIGAIVAQVAPSFQVNNAWQFAALLALLAFNIYSAQSQKGNNEAQKKRTETISDKVDVIVDKTEIVHKALNSQLDLFKKEAADQYKLALEQGIRLVQMAADNAMKDKLAAMDARHSLMEAKVAALEVKLDTAREKAVTLAASKLSSDSQIPMSVAIASPSPLPVTIADPKTPQERHEEIRGQ